MVFIVRGQGLSKLAAKSNYSSSDNLSSELNQLQEVCSINSESQYVDLIFYLTHGHAPLELDTEKKKIFKTKGKSISTCEWCFI